MRSSDSQADGRLDTIATGDIYDAMVIGGGIVGAGVARDAAMRGLRAVLVEQSDFASGTSSRSSRLLHGGLRYLAQGRVGLVREASLEKRVIQEIAPHLAEPLPFVFPTYKGSHWKRWKLGIGVKVYDLLCNGRNFGKSQTLGTQEVIERLPGIARDSLTGAVRYYDGFTNDARLVIDTLRSASLHGATLLNYTRFDEATPDQGEWSCRIYDSLAGQHATLRAKMVINAAGPWADRFKQSRTPLRLTKGVHLVIDRKRLPMNDAVVMAQGERILFAIPWGERMILGTTDTDYDGPLDAPTCDDADVCYVLDVANSVFHDAQLTRDDVIATWAGLRPLIANGHEKGTPSDTSRSHRIRMTEPGWIDVAGGKLTTYRLMAEQVVDRIVKHIGASAQPCDTAERPLLNPHALRGSGVLPPEVTREQVGHYCRNEWSVHLDDVMIRRSSWAYYHEDSLAIAVRVAGWMAEFGRWDRARVEAELHRYKAVMIPGYDGTQADAVVRPDVLSEFKPPEGPRAVRA
jgi:glycerol-3-phosphate dehydrogenase